MFYIIYKKDTGEILNILDKHQNCKIYYQNYPSEFIDNLDELIVYEFPPDFQNYKIINSKITPKSEQTILELKQYGKILTEEERLNILLMPSYEEIQKAQTTIEILSLLQEVQVI